MSIHNLSIPARLGIGVGVGLVFGACAAWLSGAVLLEFWATGRIAGVDWTATLQEYASADPNIQRRVGILSGGLGLGLLALSLYGSLRGPSTSYGDARFASVRDLKSEKYASRLGSVHETDHEIILAKVGDPKARDGLFIKTEQKPHVLMVAPTESGKTTGFAIPNLLHFNGSVVVLDVKGELFETTARRRLDMGDLVFNFRPEDPTRSHGYNPLHLAAQMDDLDKRWVEVSDVVNYLVSPQNASMEGFADSGKAIFTAVVMVLLQRKRPFIGDALAIITKADPTEYRALAAEAEYPRAQAELVAAAQQEPKILKSYVSVLLNSGLGLWRDPMVDKVTRRTDFDFATLRKTPQTIYFHVPTKRTQIYAPLIRLFFNHLIGALQTNEPKTGEDFKVLIMLDEFDQLGTMPMVPEAFKTIRGYGGRLAVITQSLAGIEKIYGREEVRNMLTNAGNKIFMATDDKETTEYISNTIGDKTRFQASRSYDAKTGISSSASVREEGARLMRSEEVSRLDADSLLILRTQLMPVRAKKIKWYADPWFIEAQKTPEGKYVLPMPDPKAVKAAARDADAAFAISGFGASEEENVSAGPAPAKEPISAKDEALVAECRQKLKAVDDLVAEKTKRSGTRKSLRERRAQISEPA